MGLFRAHARQDPPPRRPGELPADYQSNLGDVSPTGFDARCCRFLRIDYGELRARTLEGCSDEEVLYWAERRGSAR